MRTTLQLAKQVGKEDVDTLVILGVLIVAIIVLGLMVFEMVKQPPWGLEIIIIPSIWLGCIGAACATAVGIVESARGRVAHNSRHEEENTQ